MSTLEKVKYDVDGNYELLPKKMELLWSRAKLEEAVLVYQGKGFCYPVTFTTYTKPLVPDKEDGWVSGLGKLVVDHMFFFECPMDRMWANEISMDYQGYHAKYIGLEQTFVNHKPNSSREFVTQSFAPENLGAWMRLFCNLHADQTFVPRNPAAFLKEHGSEKETIYN